MLSHIHHINFVVNDLGKSMVYFNHLLTQSPIIETLLERNVKTARYKIGETYLVLVQPLSSVGVVATILDKKGEGVFLVSFATPSINDALRELEIDYKNKREGLDGWQISDLSAAEQFGVILQLTQATGSK
jgi:methylmalonyl-CoA/ethylmalonyl-CoA epimerase